MAEKLSFKVSATLKDLIGRELVTNKLAAVFELVKNSYDAYSPYAKIVFDNESGGEALPLRIAIIDGGKGMTAGDIKGKWMFLGHSEKRDSQVGPPLLDGLPSMQKRTMAGTKGIGRFSCDKLGSFLDMYTRTAGPAWNHLQVDWGNFEVDQTTEFQTINSLLDAQGPPGWTGAQDLDHGTVICISGLRERWEFDDVLRLRRLLERLMDPFNEEDQGFRIEIVAPMFRKEEEKPGRKKHNEAVNGPVKNQLSRRLAMTTTMISCKMRDGKAASQLLDKGRLIYTVVDDISKYALLKQAHADIDIFYLSKAAKAKFTTTMGIEPVNYGSVMLYRNNFRVMPFGEPRDDWLLLERRKGQGTKRFLASRELIGHISITEEGRTFEEVSSRSAGIENEEALHDLRDFVVEKLVRRLERYVVDVISWDSPRVLVTAEERGEHILGLVTSLAGGEAVQVTAGDGAYEAIKEAEMANADAIIQNLKALSAAPVGKEAAQSLKENISALKTVMARAKEEVARKDEETLFLEKKDAKRGEFVSMMQHAFHLSKVRAEPLIEETIREALSLNLPGSFIEKLGALKVLVMELEMLARLSSMAAFDLGKEKVRADVVSYTSHYIRSQWADALNTRGILSHIMHGEATHEMEADLLAYSLVIDNFLDNAIKAGARNIYVQFQSEGGRLVTMFSDDGDGVSGEALPKLFTPGFSTRGGTGLGLFSARRILEGMGGKVEFAGNSVQGLGRGACFRVVV